MILQTRAGPSPLSVAPIGDSELDDSDLFSHVGIFLAPVEAVTSDYAAPEVGVSNYARHGRSWKVYHNLTNVEDAPEAACGKGQFSLGLPIPSTKVTRAIPPQYALFMSATIRGFCRESRLLQNAASHLMAHDILYLGDLTRMSRRELAFCLGRYRDLAKLFEELLDDVGLGFDARAPWWQRPTDYYATAY